MSCKNLFSRPLLRIGFLWIFLLSSLVYSQDILEISQLNGINVPGVPPPASIALPATCPNASYQFFVTITNNSGGTINFGGSPLNVNVTVTGSNPASYNLGAGGSLANGASATVSFTINLSNPGNNTLTASITGAAIAGEVAPNLDDNLAAATITSNAVATNATLNSSAGTTICEGDIVTISSGGGSTYHFFLNGAPLTVNPTNAQLLLHLMVLDEERSLPGYIFIPLIIGLIVSATIQKSPNSLTCNLTNLSVLVVLNKFVLLAKYSLLY